MNSIRRKFLLSAMLMLAGQLAASAQEAERDSLCYKQTVQHYEVLTTLEPTYLKEVTVGSPWSRNWFITVDAGASAFRGSPLGCEDLFGRIQPAIQASVGKWFTPHIGVRATYQGWKFKDANIEKNTYHAAHLDLLWNIIGSSSKDELGLSRWTVAPYFGVGVIHHQENNTTPFAFNYGAIAAYRLDRRLSVNIEFAGLNTFRSFDGMGDSRKLGDQMFTLSAGLTVSLGKVGWRRAVDANPYRQQNEYLMDYINDLLEKNRQERGDSLRFQKNSGKNGEYSGLASLRARLAHRDWNGQGAVPRDGFSDEDWCGRGDASQGTVIGLSEGDWNGQMVAPRDTVAGQYEADRRLIGVPFYFFFNINTCDLTDDSQLQNLTNLARVAKALNLDVYVDGAADSATGTEVINVSLSEGRANYIAQLLCEQGVPEDAIHVSAKGGIDKFTPIQRNRHTRVMIKK